MMSTFGNTKMLKSQYINTFGFYIFLNAPKTLTGIGFQGFPKGAYVYVALCPVRKPFFPKVFISPPLGTFSEYGHVTDLDRGSESKGYLIGETSIVSEPKHQAFITIFG
jgi:hypothetical protein